MLLYDIFGLAWYFSESEFYEKEISYNLFHHNIFNFYSDYILSAANIINEVFSRYGTCYRIGGDEFCVMIKNASKCPVSQLADLLETKEQTRSRADALMYDNKRKSKQTINEQSHT